MDLAGCLYQQLTAERGARATGGPFCSIVAAVGVQAGHLFQVAGTPIDVNLLDYCEFDAEHRTQGTTIFVMASIPIGGKKC